MEMVAPPAARRNNERRSREAGPSLEQLTQRERQVVGLLANYNTSKRIARELGIREGTVNMHIVSARRKWDLRDRYETARMYAQLSAKCAPVESGSLGPWGEPTDASQTPEGNCDHGFMVSITYSDRTTRGDAMVGKTPQAPIALVWRLGPIIVGAILLALLATTGLATAHALSHFLDSTETC